MHDLPLGLKVITLRGMLDKLISKRLCSKGLGHMVRVFLCVSVYVGHCIKVSEH